ncbi:MAG: ribbon-helix-helix protein, CopG family [Desulfurococcales archaeon]|nr:ribbon-helix-helix protein, CopG family [Desulfurococcales archaeon]
MRVVTFKIEDELIRKIDKYAYEHGLTRSEVIRRALKSYLERETQKIVTKRLKVYA